MKKEEFIEQFNKTSENIDEKWMKNVIKDSIDANDVDRNKRGHRNLIIVMEELAELTQEISKELRDKGDIMNILQELADVQLGVYYVQDICGIDDEDLHRAMNVKTKRVEKKLQKYGQHK